MGSTLAVLVLCAVPLGLLATDLVRRALRRRSVRSAVATPAPRVQPASGRRGARCPTCSADVPLALWRVDRGPDGIVRVACPVCGTPAVGRPGG